MLSQSHSRKFCHRSQAWCLFSSDSLSLNLHSTSWLLYFYYCTLQLFLFRSYSYFTETINYLSLWGPHVMHSLLQSKTQAPHSTSTSCNSAVTLLPSHVSSLCPNNCFLFTLAPVLLSAMAHLLMSHSQSRLLGQRKAKTWRKHKDLSAPAALV